MARFFNTFLPALACFFVGFTWFYYYTKIGWASALSSGTLTLVLSCALYFLLGKPTKKQIKIQNKAKEASLCSYLALSGGNTKLFSEYYSLSGYTVEIKDGDLIVTKKQQSVLVCLRFTFAPLDADEYAKCLKKSLSFGAETLLILCCRASPAVYALLNKSSQQVKVREISFVYSLLNESKLLPPLEKQKKMEFSVFFSYAFAKDRAVLYLMSAAGLALTSVFTLFPLYPLIFATLLTAAGIYSRFNKRFNPKED